MSEMEQNPRNLLLHALQALSSACMPHLGGVGVGVGGGGRESVALFRTMALHLYAWRGSEDTGTGDNISPMPSPSPAVVAATAAVESAASTRAADERHTEMMLTKAVELEPFHVPTLTALAFVILQRGSGGGGGGSGRGMVRAEELLERAVEVAGRRGACSCLLMLGGARSRAWGQSPSIGRRSYVWAPRTRQLSNFVGAPRV